MGKQTPVVLIGGGVGLTPVLSMLNTIVDTGSKRETWFFYGLRHGGEHVMKEYLEQVAKENENIHLQICYSAPREGEDIEGTDYQHAERVSADLFKRILPSNNYDFYICAPPPMMTAVTEGLYNWGVPEKNVHFEAFGPASAKKTAPPKDAAPPAGTEFTVKFAKSNESRVWDPEIGALLDFAEELDVPMDSGCRAGNCGTCKTAIVSGEVTDLHEPGEMPEAGSCLTCIARGSR